LLTDPDRAKVTGAIALNLEQEDPRKAFVIFNSVNVILGTGGPAGIYETSVYPVSQSGSTGMAFSAGATGQNLTESQFGIASTRFRWNLSGSYQQVLPRYVSTDAEGQNSREFLNEFFPDYKTLTRAIFLKGYQWPFDPRKVHDHGSSLIDLIVDREININHRKVFLDFTKNPTWEGREDFSPSNLENDVLSYLEKSDALKSTPLERLEAMNYPATELYKSNGIDLSEEKLEIAVCNQHNNGGLKGNIWWESDLRHLFPVGEVNGSHGVYRPGGSALNSGQVGSYRAAQYISKRYAAATPDRDVFLKITKEKIEEVLELSGKWLKQKPADIQEYFREIRKRMSSCAGIIRDAETVRDAALHAHEMNLAIPGKLAAQTTGDLKDCFLLMDHCITHCVYLQSLKYYLENGGRSRGSYLVTAKRDSDIPGFPDPELCSFDREIELKIIESKYKRGKVSFKLQEVREIPIQDLWFEKVWKEYLQDI
jgi:succinate dehydrogenase/fumarate reductase flavoprotein subunit